MARRFNSVEPLDCLFLPWPYFDFDGFMRWLEKVVFTGFVRDFLGPSLWPPNKKLICYPFDTVTGKYDLSRLNPGWLALFVDRIAAICDAGIIPILTVREWCGILARWNLHPWNRKNNRQGLGADTQLEMCEQKAIDTLVMPLFDMCIAALKPKYRKQIQIQISNEPPMFKWKSRLGPREWIFPVADSEKALLASLRKRGYRKDRVSASCSEDTFHAYGEGAFIQGVHTICAHGIRTLKECDALYAGPPYEGFGPGGKYRKYFAVAPNSDGPDGTVWDISAGEIHKIAKKYEGYGVLCSVQPGFQTDEAGWRKLWNAAEPPLRALQESA